MPEPAGFNWTLLSNIARLESGHTPKRSEPRFWDGGIPWIGIRDATGNHGQIIADTAQHITQEGLDNSSARLLPAGTVCLSRTASVGYVVQTSRPMATSQDFVNWVCGPKLVPDYLRYIMMLEQESIRRFSYGTTHQTMYYPDAKALHVLVPERSTQEAIVEVLGALDHKIAANAKLINTGDLLSEATTRAVVDVSSRVPLTHLAAVTMGSSPRGESLNEGGTGTVFYQGVRDFGIRTPTPRVWTESVTRLAQAGDTLLSVRAPVGRVNVASDAVCIGRGLAALRSTTAAPWTLFNLLKAHPELWAPFDAEGTIFSSINRAGLEGLAVPTVPSARAARLEDELAAIELLIAAHNRESNRLAELRDALLPELMSGRLRVKDGERAVEEAV